MAFHHSSAIELEALLHQLRRHGADHADVEVTTARGGLPEHLGRTVCAFANMPEGGTIILGVADPDFSVVGVGNSAVIEAGIASVAQNAVSPAQTVTTHTVTVGKRRVVTAVVQPLSVMLKPALFEGNPYLRQADGDYIMPASEQRMLEIAKLTDREVEPYETLEVPDTYLDDLNEGLADQFMSAMRRTASQLRHESDEQILRDTRVTINGHLTIAGLYGLGKFPQGAFPSLTVTAAVRRVSGTARTANLETFYGPVPELFDQTMEWISRNLTTYQTYQPDGHMVSVPEIPLSAIREAVANALVHRDLGPNTVEAGKAINIRIAPNSLIVSSPGGLKSLTVTQLLSNELTRVEVNQRLYRIARHATDMQGRRIIEGEGGGIHMMLREMRRAGLPDPQITDTGVKVTVRFARVPLEERRPPRDEGGSAPVPGRRAAPKPESDHTPSISLEGSRTLTRNAAPIIDALVASPDGLTIADIASKTGLPAPAISYPLRALRDDGAVILDGGPGNRRSTYKLAKELRSS